MRGFGFFGEIGGNFFHFCLAIAIRRVRQSFHCDEIDHASECFFRANRQLQRHNATPKDLPQRIKRAFVTRQFPVHPIDHECARLVVLGRIVPGFFRHYLNAVRGVDKNQRRIGGDQRGFRFIDERGIARRIEEIDFDFFRLAWRLPFGKGEPAIDRDFSRDFFFVPVSDGRTVGDLTQPRRHTRGEEQRRHELGFPRGAVAYNAHVAYPFGVVGFHVSPRLEISMQNAGKLRLEDGPLGTGISWEEILKRESEL